MVKDAANIRPTILDECEGSVQQVATNDTAGPNTIIL